MTTTSKKRREVAEMLREQAYEGYGINLESMLYALGLDPDDEERGDEDVFEMLADLIDPTCEIERIEPIGYGEFNQTIGYYFDLTCGHTVRRPYMDMPPKYCDECGARVVIK